MNLLKIEGDLSGKTSNTGWVRSKIVKGEDEFNSIRILSKENVYDIYVNNTFLTSLFSTSLNKGNMGILIGRDAKSRIAYYYLSVPSETTNNLIEGNFSYATHWNHLIRGEHMYKLDSELKAKATKKSDIAENKYKDKIIY